MEGRVDDLDAGRPAAAAGRHEPRLVEVDVDPAAQRRRAAVVVAAVADRDARMHRPGVEPVLAAAAEAGLQAGVAPDPRDQVPEPPQEPRPLATVDDVDELDQGGGEVGEVARGVADRRRGGRRRPVDLPDRRERVVLERAPLGDGELARMGVERGAQAREDARVGVVSDDAWWELGADRVEQPEALLAARVEGLRQAGGDGPVRGAGAVR